VKDILSSFHDQFRFHGDRSLEFDKSLLSEGQVQEVRDAIANEQEGLRTTLHAKTGFFSRHNYTWMLSKDAFGTPQELAYQKMILRTLVMLHSDRPEMDLSNICLRRHPTGDAADEAVIASPFRYILASAQFDRILDFTAAIFEDAVAACQERGWAPSYLDSTGNFLGGASLGSVLREDLSLRQSITLRSIAIFFDCIRYRRPRLADLGLPGYRRWGIDTTLGNPTPERMRALLATGMKRRHVISAAARRYSIFHELAHLLLHDFSTSERNDAEEQEADSWAIRFLRGNPDETSYSNEQIDLTMGYEILRDIPFASAGVYFGVLEMVIFFRMTLRWLEIGGNPEGDEDMRAMGRQRDEIARRTKLVLTSSILDRAIQIANRNEAPDFGVTDFHRAYMEIQVLLDSCKSMIVEWIDWKAGHSDAARSNWNLPEADRILTSIIQ
jgi:hypothetical protein